jgi:D-alanyl-D-alanine carboxypeptidase/D-alanyl-D-alanine-endopeptidase (penicillin-binding protein 4)
MVVSLTRGDTLLARGADQALIPASTLKMYTAAIALERLGPDWRFSTDVLRDGALAATAPWRGTSCCAATATRRSPPGTTAAGATGR